MKTTILIHEHDQWFFYPEDSNKIEHISVKTNGECFFFDPVSGSATIVIPQPYTPDDPRAGHLYISLNLNKSDSNWFLDKPSRIKGLKEWMKCISKAAKQYALESLPLPLNEIEEMTDGLDKQSGQLNDAEKKIALQFMTAIIQKSKPEIYVIARDQSDDLIINVLKSLPKVYREKVTIAMPWSSGLDVARVSITDEEELPIISGSLYCVSESSEALKNQYQEAFATAEMFYYNPGLAEDLVAESDISKASNFYKEVRQQDSEAGQEEFSELYDFYIKTNKSIKLIEVLNKDFNEFYKKYRDKDLKQIWEVYQFQKDLPAYKDHGWDELLRVCAFYNNPAVQDIVAEDREPVYKFFQEIGDINKSVKFYNSYKDLISQRSDIKQGDILNKKFYDFHNKHKSEYTMDEILDLYFNDIEIPEKSVEIYGKYNSLLSNKKLDRKNILNKNFSDFHDKAKNIGPDVVLDLYIFYDKKCPENNKPELSDIFEPYFYLILKDFETSDSQEILNVCGFYKELYLQSKVLSYHVLREYYKEIVKTYPKLRPSEVLTEDFLGFFEYKVPQQKPEPNKIWNVYKFQKGVPEYKYFGWAELSSLHNFGQQLNQKPEHQILIKLHDFYEKFPDNSKPEPQKILDFYNLCRDFLKSDTKLKEEDIFNKDCFNSYKESNDPSKAIGSYLTNQDSNFQKFKKFTNPQSDDVKSLKLNVADLQLTEYEPDKLFKLKKELDNNDFKKAVKTYRKSNDSDKALVLLYDAFDKHLADWQKLSADHIVILYKICKKVVDSQGKEKKEKPEKFTSDDIFNLYEIIYKALTENEVPAKGCAPVNNTQLSLSYIFEFYKKFKKLLKNIKKSECGALYKFYVDNKDKTSIEEDVEKLWEFYKVVKVEKERNRQEFKPADIFNPSFYGFYINVVGVNKNFVRSDYPTLYEFYSQNIVEKVKKGGEQKEGEQKLSSFYESYKTLVADGNNDFLAKLIAPVRRFFSKNQHRLEIFEKFFEYYTNNVTKDNAKSILNKDFYEFFKKVVDAKIDIDNKIPNLHELYKKAYEEPENAVTIFEGIQDETIRAEIINVWNEFPHEQKPADATGKQRHDDAEYQGFWSQIGKPKIQRYLKISALVVAGIFVLLLGVAVYKKEASENTRVVDPKVAVTEPASTSNNEEQEPEEKHLTIERVRVGNSQNGEQSLSIYKSVQEGMTKFMKEHNMVGSVFAYRPSNGDIYCMASTPTSENVLDQNNKNFGSFKPGATIMPLTFLLLQAQGVDLNDLKLNAENEQVDKENDRYKLESGGEIGCWGHHTWDKTNKKDLLPMSASDGLGNLCDTFFAMSVAEKNLNLDFVNNELKAMGFYVNKYEGKSPKVDHSAYPGTIDGISYNRTVFPLEESMELNLENVNNFIGKGSLLVSPIDMAVLTALFGKLSSEYDSIKNSPVYFPRIYLPADETKQKDGSQELLLTTQADDAGQNHIAQLSRFVSENKKYIAEVGKILRKAFEDHYRKDSKECRKDYKSCHLDENEKSITAWSQWIDMAQVGIFPKQTDQRPQTLSLYSEELDLAAYIVIENYRTKTPSKIKLGSTSMMLTKLVAEAIGKTLDPDKYEKEDEQWGEFEKEERNAAELAKRKPQNNKNQSNGNDQTKKSSKAPATQQESTPQQQ